MELQKKKNLTQMFQIVRFHIKARFPTSFEKSEAPATTRTNFHMAVLAGAEWPPHLLMGREFWSATVPTAPRCPPLACLPDP